MIRPTAAFFAVALVLDVLFAIASTPAMSVENRYGIAVIIGNKTYSDKIPAVEFAHNDATAMKDYVANVLGFRPGNIIDLRDATKAGLEATFGVAQNHKGRLFNWVRKGKSDVVAFYSGHGVPGLKDRRGYLLPSDGEANLAELTGYPLDTLLTNLENIPARSMTSIMDACFSGNTPKGMVVKAISGLGVMPRESQSSGMILLTAARGDQVTSWDETAKHGLFTSHLLLALSGKADEKEYGNGDGKVTLSKVTKYLDDEMTYQARRRYNRDQNPTIEGPPDRVLATYTLGAPGGAGLKRPSASVSVTPPASRRPAAPSGRGWLGVRIQAVTDVFAQILGLDKTSGALVADMTPGGPAEASMIEVGDVILTFDGMEVDTMRTLPPIVAETPAGKHIVVEVWRQGRKRILDLVVGGTDSKPVVVARSERSARVSPLLASRRPEAEKEVSVLGLLLSTVTPELRERFSLEDSIEGVVATEVEEGSAAANRQIRPGDVIGKVGFKRDPIYWPSQVRKLVDEARGTNQKYIIWT